MTGQVILDTGPLVAALDAGEKHHRWAVEQFKTIRPPLITSEAILTEACHIVRRSDRAVDQIAEYLSSRLIESRCPLSTSPERVFGLIRKFRDVPMSLADASVVALVEQNPDSLVFTMDAHFHVYRQRNRRVIRTIFP